MAWTDFCFSTLVFLMKETSILIKITLMTVYAFICYNAWVMLLLYTPCLCYLLQNPLHLLFLQLTSNHPINKLTDSGYKLIIRYTNTSVVCMLSWTYYCLVEWYPHISNWVSIIIYCITLTWAYLMNNRPSFQDIHVSI